MPVETYPDPQDIILLTKKSKNKYKKRLSRKSRFCSNDWKIWTW